MTQPTTPPRILVIDDEAQIRRFLRISLRSQGYDVLEAETAASGIELAATQTPDLIVLDLGLPDTDGKSVIDSVRGWSAVPILILSVRASESEKVLAFDGGANDYLTKPFGVQEFLARIRNLLRMSHGLDAAIKGVYDDGRLRIDLAQHRVWLDGEVVALARKEYALLAALITHPGQVITQTQLLRELWGPGHVEDTHYLRIVVGKLRQKLADSASEPRYIETEPGVGYRFVGFG